MRYMNKCILKTYYSIFKIIFRCTRVKGIFFLHTDPLQIKIVFFPCPSHIECELIKSTLRMKL